MLRASESIRSRLESLQVRADCSGPSFWVLDVHLELSREVLAMGLGWGCKPAAKKSTSGRDLAQ